MKNMLTCQLNSLSLQINKSAEFFILCVALVQHRQTRREGEKGGASSSALVSVANADAHICSASVAVSFLL